MPKQEMMTTREFAEAIGRHYLTVLSWLREELIPGAEATQETSGTVYKIPRSAVAKFKNKSPRRRGRPRKTSSDQKA
ncbi:MAG: hypothetical protein ACREDR_25955 [Blastocatellia bacterium]